MCSQKLGFGEKLIEEQIGDAKHVEKSFYCTMVMKVFLSIPCTTSMNHGLPSIKYHSMMTLTTLWPMICKAYKGKSPPKACRFSPNSVSYAGEATKWVLFPAMEMPMGGEPEPPA